MSVDEFSAYGYFFLTLLLVIGTYSYIYHLYKKRKDATGIDYEHYSKMALNDDIDATPVKPMKPQSSDEKKK